jgi:hypothetical protein
MKGAGEEFRDPRRIVDLGYPFDDVAEHPPVVDLLECLALAHLASDLADEQDHRRRILHGDMQASGGVGSTRSARDKTDAGLTGHLAPRFRHHRRATLMPGNRHGNRRIMQRVEHVQIALAGDTEHTLDTIGLQRLDNEVAAGAGREDV